MSSSMLTSYLCRSSLWSHRYAAWTLTRSVAGTTRCLTTLGLKSRLDKDTPSLNHWNNHRRLLLLNTNHQVTTQVRGKKKRSNTPRKDESDDESDDDDEDEEQDDLGIGGYDDMTIVVPSLRIDNVLMRATKLARAKVDEGFFDSRVRLNEEKTTKKGELCTVHDIIDFIHGKHPDNEDMLTVDRVEVVSVPDIGLNTGKMKVKVRRYKSLQIANYPRDPYDGPAVFVKGQSKK